MLVKSKIKEYLKKRGCRMSKNGWNGLEKELKKIIRSAIKVADEEGRMTLKEGDF